MPAITSGKVLVTGANGYVAAWVVQDLLEHGFSVRGTVRAESKADYLRNRFATFGDKFEISIVPDISQEGAFDKAVEGVDAIMHLASPAILTATDPDSLITPAVKGTLGLISSALKHRKTIQRVLYMSSAAAIWNPPPAGQKGFARILDETVWNEYSVGLVREKGREAPGPDMYRASKTLAERAAWEVYEREKTSPEGLNWELVTFACPLVFGPMLHETTSVSGLSASTGVWYDRVIKQSVTGDGLTKEGWEYVDVRDLARAHVLGLTVTEAGGERFMISAGPYVCQQFVDIARKYSDKVPEGEASYNLEEAVYPVRYTAEKGKRVLGLQYHTMEETTKDAILDLQERRLL